MKEAGKTYYSDELIKLLADKYLILENSQNIQLIDFLERTGEFYFSIKNSDAEKLNSKDIRRHIAKTKNLAVKLESNLAEMSDVTRQVFWAPENVVSMEQADRGRTHSSFGHLFFRFIDKDGFEASIRTEPETIVDALNILEKYADHALDNLRARKSGRPADEALRMWAVNIHSFWTNALERDFTFYDVDGVPATEAYNFCIDAMKSLDPEVTSQAIATAMRKVITNKSRLTRKNLGQKSP